MKWLKSRENGDSKAQLRCNVGKLTRYICICVRRLLRSGRMMIMRSNEGDHDDFVTDNDTTIMTMETTVTVINQLVGDEYE